MLHVVAVTDLIVDHLTESREAEAEIARARRRADRWTPAARTTLFGGFARSLFRAGA